MPTPEKITPEQVDHIARLARLELTAEEREMFAQQLSDILAYGAEMNALNLDEVAPTTHPVDQGNVWREDTPGAVSDRSEVLAEAPDSEADQFKVMPVLGEG